MDSTRSPRVTEELSVELEAALTAAQLLPLVDRTVSREGNLSVVVHENQRRNAIHGWGNKIGTHVFPPIFDRNPFTDGSGAHRVAKLEEVKALPGYQFADKWTVQVIDKSPCQTDRNGYEYAEGWFAMKLTGSSTSPAEQAATTVRRRRWIRHMVKRHTSQGNSSKLTELTQRISAVVEDELVAHQLVPFLDRSSSTDQSIRICCYENERRNWVYGWGNIQGVHLYPPVFDRFPYSDDEGQHHVNSLASIDCIFGYMWVDDWKVCCDIDDTSQDGYQYAEGWFGMRKGSGMLSSYEKPTTVVRRRLWIRTMIPKTADAEGRKTSESSTSTMMMSGNGGVSASTSMFSPYTLKVTILSTTLANAKYNSKGLVAELVIGDEIIGQTHVLNAAPYAWNFTFSVKVVSIDPKVVIRCNIVTVSSAMFGVTRDIVGYVIPSMDQAWAFKDRNLISSYPLLKGKCSGHVDLGMNLISNELFCINSMVPGAANPKVVERLTERPTGLDYDADMHSEYRRFTEHGTPIDQATWGSEALADLMEEYTASPAVKQSLTSASTCTDVLHLDDIESVLKDLSYIRSKVPSFTDPTVHKYTYPAEGFVYAAELQTISQICDLKETSAGDADPAQLGLIGRLGEMNQKIADGTPRLSSFMHSKKSLHGSVMAAEAHEKLTPPFDCVLLTTDGDTYILRFEKLDTYLGAMKALSLAMTGEQKATYTGTCKMICDEIHENDERDDATKQADSRINKYVQQLQSEILDFLGMQASQPDAGGDSGKKSTKSAASTQAQAKPISTAINWDETTLTVNDQRDFCLSMVVTNSNARKSVSSERGSASSMKNPSSSSNGQNPLEMMSSEASDPMSAHRIKLSNIDTVGLRNTFWKRYTHTLEIKIHSISGAEVKGFDQSAFVSLMCRDGQYVCTEPAKSFDTKYFGGGDDPDGRHHAQRMVKSAALDQKCTFLVDENDILKSKFDANRLMQATLHLGSYNDEISVARSGEVLLPVEEINKHRASVTSGMPHADYVCRKNDSVKVPCRRTNFGAKLTIECARNLNNKKISGRVNAFFVVYLIDGGGLPVGHVQERKIGQGKLVKKMAGQETANFGNLYLPKSAGIYRSKCAKGDVNPLFKDEVTITKAMGLQHAAYVLVEIWDDNTIRKDTCLGEVFIPLYDIAKEKQPMPRSLPVRPSKKMTSIPEGTLGDLHFTLHSVSEQMSYAADLFLNMSYELKPIVVDDFLWPARILTGDTTNEPPTVYIDVTYEGLAIMDALPKAESSGPGAESKVKERRGSMLYSGRDTAASGSEAQAQLSESQKRLQILLQSCIERVHVLHSRVDLIVPWSQVEIHDAVVLCNSMLMIGITLNRQMKPSKNASAVIRPMYVELLIGPCPAFEMRNLIGQRTAVDDYRQAVFEVASSDDHETVFRGLCDEIQKMTNEILNVKIRRDEVSSTAGFYNDPRVTQYAVGINFTRYQSILRSSVLKKMRFQGYFGYLIELATGHSDRNSGSLDMLREKVSVTAIEQRIERTVGLIASANKSLVDRFDEMIETLQTEATKMALAELSTNTEMNAEGQREFYQRLCFRLGKVIHIYYSNILGFLQSHMHDTGSAKQSTTQLKLSFLQILLQNDDRIDNVLSPLLNSCELQFSVRPLLSWTLPFDTLINDFAILLNAEVLMWESRAIKQFVRETDSLIPWEIDLLRRSSIPNKTTDDRYSSVYISTIPESILEQLNIQIYAKKLDPCRSLCGKNLAIVEAINGRIASAVGTSYTNLAEEYVAALDVALMSLREVNRTHGMRESGGMNGNAALSAGVTATTTQEPDVPPGHPIIPSAKTATSDTLVLKSGKSAPFLPSVNEDEVKLLQFIVSVANDCHRVVTSHIPMCEADLFGSKSSGSGAGGVEGAEAATVGATSGVASGSEDLFAHVIYDFEKAQKSAIKSLAAVFFEDIGDLFYADFSMHWLDSLSYDATIDSKARRLSHIDVILKTLSEFRANIACYLENACLHSFDVLCCDKITQRYLVFLRDVAYTACMDDKNSREYGDRGHVPSTDSIDKVARNSARESSHSSRKTGQWSSSMKGYAPRRITELATQLSDTERFQFVSDGLAILNHFTGPSTAPKSATTSDAAAHSSSANGSVGGRVAFAHSEEPISSTSDAKHIQLLADFSSATVLNSYITKDVCALDLSFAAMVDDVEANFDRLFSVKV